MSAETRSLVVGLKWKRLEQDKENKKIKESETNEQPYLLRERNSDKNNKNSGIGKETKRFLRMDSMREALGSIRQKLRVSTRRKKRLVPTSPGFLETPESVRQRSARRRQSLDSCGGVKMYSPFTIDTPTRTPSRIRMGLQTAQRRFNSPRRLSYQPASVGKAALEKIPDDFSDTVDVDNRQSTYRRSPRIASQMMSPTGPHVSSNVIFV